MFDHPEHQKEPITLETLIDVEDEYVEIMNLLKSAHARLLKRGDADLADELAKFINSRGPYRT